MPMRKLLSVCWSLLFLSGIAVASDPLADDISRWKQFLETNKSSSEDWKSIKEGSLPLIEKASKAVAEGKRNAAVHYLAAVRGNLAGSRYVQDHNVTAETKLTTLEEDWKTAARALEAPAKPDLEGLPASMRAVAEASYSEIKVYYDSSLEYARATMPEYGYFYLGLAQGQLQFVDVLSTVKQDSSVDAPSFPGLAQQMDQLEDELLAAYKPPASIDQHPIFIRTSALIKQARELESAGLKFGALYRLLQARQFLCKVTDPSLTVTPEQINANAQQAEEQLKKSQSDQSIARIFLERAMVEPDDAQTAAAIFQKVLPLYHAALQPSKTAKKAVPPVATVTFVRWPYT